jgi:hypothetical protein
MHRPRAITRLALLLGLLGISALGGVIAVPFGQPLPVAPQLLRADPSVTSWLIFVAAAAYGVATLVAAFSLWQMRPWANISANPQMIELRRLGSKTRLDIPQTLSIGQLREGHAQVLIQTREALDLVLPGITRHAPAERRQRKMAHQLRKNELALMHRSTPRRGPRSRCARPNRCSNRDQENKSFSVSCSTT